jgi:hypothetical protein
MKRTFPLALPLVAVCTLAWPLPAAAQYDYGGSGRGGGGSAEAGFIVLLEAGLANARNADVVLATDLASSAVSPVHPSWDDEFSGRLGLGWGFGNGHEILGTFWRFETETGGSDSGLWGLPIGPPISDGASYFGTVGGFFDSTVEIRAATADVAWVLEHEMIERLSCEWLLGLRYASFEETHEAYYDEAPAAVGFDSYAAAKQNESTMFGARAGLRATYRFGPMSVGAGLALSFLDGELTASSGLTPSGSANSGLASSSTVIEDDGRSGRITDFDLRLAWHHSRDRVRVWAGWEQAEWDQIAADPTRNFPGTAVPLSARDSMTFSAYKLGVEARF